MGGETELSKGNSRKAKKGQSAVVRHRRVGAKSLIGGFFSERWEGDSSTVEKKHTASRSRNIKKPPDAGTPGHHLRVPTRRKGGRNTGGGKMPCFPGSARNLIVGGCDCGWARTTPQIEGEKTRPTPLKSQDTGATEQAEGERRSGSGAKTTGKVNPGGTSRV